MLVFPCPCSKIPGSEIIRERCAGTREFFSTVACFIPHVSLCSRKTEEKVYGSGMMYYQQNGPSAIHHTDEKTDGAALFTSIFISSNVILYKGKEGKDAHRALRQGERKSCSSPFDDGPSCSCRTHSRRRELSVIYRRVSDRNISKGLVGR